MKNDTGKTVREWTQFVLLLFASSWGVYTFVYKEFTAPKSAPVNISMALEVRKVGDKGTHEGAKNTKMEPIEFRVTAKNPSPRTIYLLPSIWVANGCSVTSQRVKNSDEISKRIFESLNKSDRLAQVELHSESNNKLVVAAGNLFVGDELRPGEVLSRAIIFHVPREKYDLVEVSTYIPSANEPGIKLKWEAGPENSFMSRVYFKNSKGKFEEIVANEDGVIYKKGLDLQLAESYESVSLW